MHGHFLGDGGTIAGRDQFDNLSDERTLREVHGAGYVGALSAGKMHANQQLLTDVLKRRWPGRPYANRWSC